MEAFTWSEMGYRVPSLEILFSFFIYVSSLVYAIYNAYQYGNSKFILILLTSFIRTILNKNLHFSARCSGKRKFFHTRITIFESKTWWLWRWMGIICWAHKILCLLVHLPCIIIGDCTTVGATCECTILIYFFSHFKIKAKSNTDFHFREFVLLMRPSEFYSFVTISTISWAVLCS